jgi:hypothetical protein
MDIQHISVPLALITEMPTLLRKIAEGEIDSSAGLVLGEANDVDNFLNYLNDMACNAIEQIDIWVDGSDSSNNVLEMLGTLLEDYEMSSEDVEVTDKRLNEEITLLLKLVKAAESFIRENAESVQPEKEFYVYAHINDKTNELFYIGKGSKKRAWDHNRLPYWVEYVDAIDGKYTVKVLRDGLTEAEALDYEQFMLIDNESTVINKSRAAGFILDIGTEDAEE